MQRALERYRRGSTPPDPLPTIGMDGTTIGEDLKPERSGQGAATGAGGGDPAPDPAPPPKPDLGQ